MKYIYIPSDVCCFFLGGCLSIYSNNIESISIDVLYRKILSHIQRNLDVIRGSYFFSAKSEMSLWIKVGFQ